MTHRLVLGLALGSMVACAGEAPTALADDESLDFRWQALLPPTSIAASPLSASEIRVTFDDVNARETGYLVERRVASDTAFVEVSALPKDASALHDLGLAAATTYVYRVRAYRQQAGTRTYSAYSPEATATTGGSDLTPPPPAAPSALTASASSSSTIHLTWADNSTTEIGFQIERAIAAAGPYATIATTTTTSSSPTASYTDTGLVEATTYYYRVRAVGSDGVSPVSNAASATTLDASSSDCPEIVESAAGGQFSCGVATDGSLYCWGLNDADQLGTGDAIARATPTRVGADRDWRQVSAGLHYACAVKTSGALYCWGANGSGQLGTGDGAPRRAPTRVGNATDWARVVAGTEHVCALKTNGSLWCWGRNSYGEIGIGSTAGVTSPAPVAAGATWQDVAPGVLHSCGTRVDGSLWCWGRNAYGELGLGDTVQRTTPTRVGAGTWRSTSTGNSFSCGVQTDGTLWCWGFNNGYTIGQTDTTSRNVPTRVTVGPAAWRSIASGEVHSCGIATDGGLWCWGLNTAGALGLGDVNPRATPTRVGTATDWRSVVISRALHTYGGFGAIHTCGVRGAGEAACWGGNRYGQLGVGDGLPRRTPTTIECACFAGACGPCGDGACEVAAGELCTTCQVDCGTRAAVCGNGECQSGESATTCAADCGPVTPPAEWASFAQQVVTLINQRRTAGVTCPSGPKPPVPALAVHPGLERAAWLHAWDLSYSQYFSHTSCNGRTPAERAAAAGASYHGEIAANGYTSPADVVAGWIASDGHCVILMGSGHTALGAGYATQSGLGYGLNRWVVMFQ